MSVDVFHWNPSRPIRPGCLGKVIPITRPVNNFGDLIGPLIVERVLDERGIDATRGRGRLLSVGSVMHFAHDGDTVWGTGINGKELSTSLPSTLDVRAVRGPRTRAELAKRNIATPNVFGDPGLLWSRYFPRVSYQGKSQHADVTIVPNLHDWPQYRVDGRAVNPRSRIESIMARIANSDFVIGSSLHGIVIAESFGIPARLISPGVEPSFKYLDYYEGTGRSHHQAASGVEEAMDLGGESPLSWDAHPLLDAFPADMWEPGSAPSSVDT